MRRGSCAVIAFALAASGACHTWRAVPVAPGRSVDLPGRSRVALAGGRRVELARGAATPDSVVGQLRGRGGPEVRFAVPRDSVALVERRRFSPWRTAGLAYLAFGVLYAAALHLSGAPY